LAIQPVVSGNLPETGLDDDQKGPGGFGIDSQSGEIFEIFAAPIKDGTCMYTSWLIVVNNDAHATKAGLSTVGWNRTRCC
jgi:hypothetical protein